MKTRTTLGRWLAAGLIAGSLLVGGLSLAPGAAEAGHKHDRSRTHGPRREAHYGANYDAHPRYTRHYAARPRVVREYYAYPRYRTLPPEIVYWDDEPFHFQGSLGIFLSGLSIGVEFGNRPPEGYVYVDPYCDEEFDCVAAYRQHLEDAYHPALLRAVRARRACRYEDDWSR